MFTARYFTPNYFAPRYWPKVGADPAPYRQGLLVIRVPMQPLRPGVTLFRV